MGELGKKGQKFDCAKCKPEVKKARRCLNGRWDNEPGGSLPVVLLPGTSGLPFCPAKLQRDEPEFCAEMDTLLLAWKLGQVPNGGPLDTMDEDQAARLTSLIIMWENLTRAEDFKMLGRLLCGTGKE